MHCTGCGEFATNRIVIAELERLRAGGSPRIDELKYSIEIADHPWYLNWSQRLQQIILESGTPRDLTRSQKKGLRNSLTQEKPGSSRSGYNLVRDSDTNTEDT